MSEMKEEGLLYLSSGCKTCSKDVSHRIIELIRHFLCENVSQIWWGVTEIDQFIVLNFLLIFLRNNTCNNKNVPILKLLFRNPQITNRQLWNTRVWFTSCKFEFRRVSRKNRQVWILHIRNPQIWNTLIWNPLIGIIDGFHNDTDWKSTCLIWNREIVCKSADSISNPRNRRF